MNKADWLVFAGYVLICAGAAAIYRPLGPLVAGYFCLRLGGAAVADKGSE